MKYLAAVAALVSLVPGIASLTINTPSSVVQCQPQLLSWNGGTAPYYLTIIPGGQASAPPLKSFDTQSSNQMTWLVDMPPGTLITCALKDSTGATAYTDMVTIQKGPDSSCLSSSPQASTGSSGPPSSPQAADATSSSASAGSPGGAGSVGSGASTGTSRAAVGPSSAVTRTVSTQPSPVNSATTQRTTSAGAAPASTPSTAGSSTSGARSKDNVATVAVIGALGLLGAIVL